MNSLFNADSIFVKELLHMAIGLTAGLFISMSYVFSDRERNYSKSFFITTLLLPSLVAVIIPLIGTDIARAISLGGVFALVRFRSMPGDSKDLLYIFFTMAVGLAIGVEQYVAGMAIAVIISIILLFLTTLLHSGRADTAQILKVTVPENVNYMEVFNDVFDRYLTSWKLDSVKLTNMGTLFQATYTVRFQHEGSEKDFLDELRVRNGNLNILLGQPEDLLHERL